MEVSGRERAQDYFASLKFERSDVPQCAAPWGAAHVRREKLIQRKRCSNQGAPFLQSKIQGGLIGEQGVSAIDSVWFPPLELIPSPRGANGPMQRVHIHRAIILLRDEVVVGHDICDARISTVPPSVSVSATAVQKNIVEHLSTVAGVHNKIRVCCVGGRHEDE